MNLDELQIKISIELDDLNKQLKTITKSIDNTLGPKATKKLMADNNKIIESGLTSINKTTLNLVKKSRKDTTKEIEAMSKDINKSLTKAFDIDLTKFNSNITSAMNQARQTVRSACNDIRRELNAALNINGNIRVTSKTTISGSATGSSGSNVASTMASSQYIGAMIIKSTNGVIKANNANTKRMESHLDKATNKIVTQLNKLSPKTSKADNSNNNSTKQADIIANVKLIENELQSEVDNAINNINVPEIETSIIVNADGLQNEINKKIREIDVPNFKTSIDVEANGLQDEINKKIRGINVPNFKTSINIETKELKNKVDAIKKEIEKSTIKIGAEIFYKYPDTTEGKTVGSPYGPDNKALIEALKNAYKTINILNRNLSALNNLKNIKQLGVGSYGSNQLSGSPINFTQGGTSPLDTSQIEAMKKVHELMKQIRSLGRGIPSDTTSFTYGEVITPQKLGLPMEQLKKAKEIIEDVSYRVLDLETGLMNTSNFDLFGLGKLDTSQVEAMKKAFKDMQNIRKQSRMPRLNEPTEDYDASESMAKELHRQVASLMDMAQELNEAFHKTPMGIDKAVQQANFLEGALDAVLDASKDLTSLSPQIAKGFEFARDVLNQMTPGIRALANEIRSFTKPQAPVGLPALEWQDINGSRPELPDSVENIEFEWNEVNPEEKPQIPESAIIDVEWKDVDNVEEDITKVNKTLTETKKLISDLSKITPDLNAENGMEDYHRKQMNTILDANAKEVEAFTSKTDIAKLNDLKAKMREISDEIATLVSELSCIDAAWEKVNSVDDVKNTLDELLAKLDFLDADAIDIKLDTSGIEETQAELDTLRDMCESIAEAAKKGVKGLKDLFAYQNEPSQKSGNLPPLPPRHGKPTNEAKPSKTGKQPKPTIMGFGFGAYQNEIDTLVEYAKKAGEKIKKALFGKSSDGSDELAFTVEDNGPNKDRYRKPLGIKDETIDTMDKAFKALDKIIKTLESIIKDFDKSVKEFKSCVERYAENRTKEEFDKNLDVADGLAQDIQKKLESLSDKGVVLDPDSIDDVYKRLQNVSDKIKSLSDEDVDLGFDEQFDYADSLMQDIEAKLKFLSDKGVDLGFDYECREAQKALEEIEKTLKDFPDELAMTIDPSGGNKLVEKAKEIGRRIKEALFGKTKGSNESETVVDYINSKTTINSNPEIINDNPKIETNKKVDDSEELEIEPTVEPELNDDDLNKEADRIIGELNAKFKKLGFDPIPTIEPTVEPELDDDDLNKEADRIIRELNAKFEKLGFDPIPTIEPELDDDDLNKKADKVMQDFKATLESMDIGKLKSMQDGSYEIHEKLLGVVNDYHDKLEAMEKFNLLYEKLMKDATDRADFFAKVIKIPIEFEIAHESAKNIRNLMDLPEFKERFDALREESIRLDFADELEGNLDLDGLLAKLKNIESIDGIDIDLDELKFDLIKLAEEIDKIRDKTDDEIKIKVIDDEVEKIKELISLLYKLKEQGKIEVDVVTRLNNLFGDDYKAMAWPLKLHTTLTEFEAKALKIFRNIKIKAAAIFSRIATPLKNSFNKVIAPVKNVANKIVTTFKRVKTTIKGFSIVIKSHLNKAFTGIKTSKIYTNVSKALNKVKGAVSKFSGTVRATLNKAFTGIKTSKVYSTISKGLSKAKTVLSKFANGCKTIWGKIKQIFSKGANDASRATGKLTSGLKGLLAQAFGFFSIYSLINLGREAITQSQTLAQSEIKLTSLMKQRMGATNDTVTAIRQLVEEQSKLGVVSKTALTRGAEQLSMYVHSAKALKDLMPAIANLTAKRGGFMATEDDAEEIATQLGEAIREGTTTPLEQSGIYLSEAEIKKFAALRTEEERAAYLANVIAKNVGNINQALANTPIGAMTQLKNNFKELLSTLGIFLANVLKPIVQWLNTIVVACNNALKALGKLLGFDMTGGATSVGDIGTGGGSTEIDTGGVDSATDSYNDAADAADKATEANEKFKGSLMGFDEINVLSDNTSSNSGSEDEYDPTDITPGEGGQLIPEVGELTEADSIFSKFSDKMKAFMDEILEPFKNAWALLGDRWKAEWADLIDSFKHFCDSLGKFLKSVWEHGGKEFVQHLAEIGLACGIAAMEIGGEILDSLARLWDHLDPAKNMNTQGFLNALNEVSVKLRDFILGLGDHFESFMANGGQDLLNAFGDLAMNIGEAIVRGFGVGIDALDGLLDHLDPANNPKTKKMLKTWEETFGSIGDMALDFVGLLESTLRNGGQEIINSLGDLGVGILDAAGIVIGEIAKTFSELFKHMDPAKNENSKNMLESFDKFVDSLSDFVDAIAKAFKKFMDSGGREFVKNLGDILAIVADLAFTLGGGIIDLITGFINSFVGQKLIEGVAKALEWFSDKLLGLKDAVQIIKDAFQDVIDIIVGIFEGDGEKVGRAFASLIKNALKLTGELVEWLVQLGMDLVAGLVKGICSLPKLLWEAVKFLFDTIVGFFKELFGIHSPSTVFADLGVNLIEGLIEGIKGMLGAVGDVLSEIGEAIFGWFEDILSSASENWNKLCDETSKKWGELKENVSEKCKDIYKDTKEKWTDIKDKTIEIASNLKEETEEKYTQFKDKLTDTTDKWRQNSEEKWNKVKEKTSEIVSNLKSTVEENYTKFKDALTNTMENWRSNSEDKWNNIKSKTSELVSNLQSDAETKYNTMKENLTNKLESWKKTSEEKWNNIKSKTSELVSNLQSDTEEKYNNMKEALNSKIESVRSTSEAAWKNIKDKASEHISNLKSDVESKYETLKNNLTSKLETWRSTSESKWKDIKEKGVSAIENIRKNGEEKFESLKTAVTTKMETIKTDLVSKWETIKNKAVEYVNSMKSDVENKYNDLKTKIGAKLEEVKSETISKWESIKSTASTKIKEVVNEATNKFGEMKSSFTSKMDEVKTALGPKWTELKNSVKTNASGIASKVSEGLSDVKQKFTKPFEDAKRAVGEVINSIGRTFSNANWSFPKIKLPHIKVTGSWSFNPPRVPSFGIEWRKRGGIIDGITPIGFANGALQMGGEAGKEMVVPLENTSFTSKIAQAMGQAVDNAMARNMNNMYGSSVNNSNDSKDIVLKVNERELARASINSINKLQRESGRTLLDI